MIFLNVAKCPKLEILTVESCLSLDCKYFIASKIILHQQVTKESIKDLVNHLPYSKFSFFFFATQNQLLFRCSYIFLLASIPNSELSGLSQSWWSIFLGVSMGVSSLQWDVRGNLGIIYYYLKSHRKEIVPFILWTLSCLYDRKFWNSGSHLITGKKGSQGQCRYAGIGRKERWK